jgi:hypothetical protein
MCHVLSDDIVPFASPIDLARVHNSWALIITSSISVLCCIFSYAFGINPQEEPDAEFAALILVRDSFSCSPTLPTFASDLVLRQMHFMIGSVLVAFAVGRVLHIMYKISSKADVGKKSSSQGNPFVGLLRNLRKNKVTSTFCCSPQTAFFFHGGSSFILISYPGRTAGYDGLDFRNSFLRQYVRLGENDSDFAAIQRICRRKVIKSSAFSRFDLSPKLIYVVSVCFS